MKMEAEKNVQKGYNPFEEEEQGSSKECRKWLIWPLTAAFFIIAVAFCSCNKKPVPGQEPGTGGIVINGDNNVVGDNNVIGDSNVVGDGVVKGDGNIIGDNKTTGATTTASTTRPTTAPTQSSDGKGGATEKPTQKPTEPTQKPTEPTQKPTEPTQKPTEPTQKPTEPTTTEKPVTTTEKRAGTLSVVKGSDSNGNITYRVKLSGSDYDIDQVRVLNAPSDMSYSLSSSDNCLIVTLHDSGESTGQMVVGIRGVVQTTINNIYY